MTLNPYEELGVARDASEQLIRRSYREKAKTAHPDANPDADPAAWERLSTSLQVLVDPEKRKKFDETGEIDAPRPNNDRAAAIQIIEQHMGAIINEYLGATADKPVMDPRLRNIPAEIAGLIRGEIAQAKTGIAMGEKVLTFLADMQNRFFLKNEDDHPEGNAIARNFATQVRQNAKTVEDMRLAIKVREIALTIIAGYEFEQDQMSFVVQTG